MPLSPACRATKPRHWRFQSRFISTASLMLGRSNPRTKDSTSPPNIRSAMSSRVMASAVAVSAAMGTPGKSCRSRHRSSYSGRNDGPHCEMQWASSTANSLTGSRPRASSMRSVMSRSGAMYRSRVSPPAARRQAATLSTRVLAELMASAATPARRSAATWSCISATSGDTTTVRPPRANAGTWKHSDLPDPVGITVST